MRLFLALFAGILFSNELVNEIYQELAKQPYATVAPLIVKMQTEAAHQPAATPVAPPALDTPKDK